MRKLQVLSIIAIVAMLSSVSIAAPPPPPWSALGSIEIPVVMDIVPVASLSLNGAIIKLEPAVGGNIGDFMGCANPLPMLMSNIPVNVTATVFLVAPDVTTHDDIFVAIQGYDWDNPSGPWLYDPAYIGNGVGIPVCVLYRNVNMAIRPEGLNERVGTVMLTVTTQ